MAEGIVYLDVDDEITSAASRIRTSPGTKVALVVPYGSRIATSRMNFRLLSREAVVSNRRLSIVSGDAAARSLAASAGLPVFGTVNEYESTIAAAAATAATGVDEAEAAEPEAATAASTSLPTEPSAPDRPAPAASLAESETVVSAAPAVHTAPVGLAAPPATAPEPAAAPARKSQRPRRPPPDVTSVAATAATGAGGASVAADHAADDETTAVRLPPLFGTQIRTPIAVAIGLVALAAVVLAVGAYLFLPAATITLTPRREPIGPLQLTVSADPQATAVDPVGLVVPAVQLEIPVEAANTFATAGKHVELTAASGSVTFENYNPLSSNTISAGSIVSTEGGIRFRTLSSVTIPAGTFVLPSVIPSRRSVDVEAVKDGTEGNVPANAIRVVPQGENPDFLKVNNPDPTGGGTRKETPEVNKTEVDKAVATLQADLDRAFQNAIAEGGGAPAGTTLFPTTAQLGPAVPDVDPQTFVGQAVESFDLRLTAKGTVIAVDPSPVRSLAETQISARVTTGHELVPGSAVIDVGEGVVGEDGEVSFLATARATQVTIVDPEVVRGLVKGRTAAEATSALAPYGDATVVLWPDWASTVTSMDSRLTVAIDTGPESGASVPPPSSPPRSSPSPRVSPSPSARPS